MTFVNGGGRGGSWWWRHEAAFFAARGAGAGGRVPLPALAAATPGAALTLLVAERRATGPHDVVIDIAFTGLCHTDLSLTREDWGPGTLLPMIPGHEITGHVAAAG